MSLSKREKIAFAGGNVTGGLGVWLLPKLARLVGGLFGRTTETVYVRVPVAAPMSEDNVAQIRDAFTAAILEATENKPTSHHKTGTKG